MFNIILGLVTSPQFVVESCDLALAFGECEDFSSEILQESMENIFNFHVDMIAGTIVPVVL